MNDEQFNLLLALLTRVADGLEGLLAAVTTVDDELPSGMMQANEARAFFDSSLSTMDRDEPEGS